MSLTCPNCGSSGAFVSFVPDVGMDGPFEIRRCRNCGHEYQVVIDVDDDPYPPEEPYCQEDIGWGTCPECGCGLYNGGAYSDGDGDLYDALFCPLCQEMQGKANERFYGEDYGIDKSLIEEDD